MLRACPSRRGQRTKQKGLDRSDQIEAERRNNVVHSHSTVFSADADEAVRYATSQGYAEQESGGREQAEGLRLVPWPEQEFIGFLEAAPDAVVIADRDGRIIRLLVATSVPKEVSHDDP